ncbi:hypothetical protein PGT21_034078 [Puccinia graminis f. sp. tritici]|uniref:Uncharacterized protein n=1 Tax=Puccinia graminis f. sp. tritici TaxID=56615 RepID=A0A5B0MH78_PUCGR|nr:hypothetical protein PGT21_034078 [Puccinia graminis f. sp. tritici]
MDASRRRPIQLIDLLKWVTRIKALFSQNQTLSSGSLNPVLQDQIFLEAVNLSLACPETFPVESDNLASNVDLNVAQALGTHLDLNPEREDLCHDRTNQASQHHCGVINHQLVPFCFNKIYLLLLERLGVCMRSSEPALLVGETGTGKTTVVSYMAGLIDKRLISLNLSNQSEASDLLGDFKPLGSAEDGKVHGTCLVEDSILT